MKAKYYSRVVNFVVIYDISDTKTRTRLSRFLFEYGIRTQLSVFEVEVKQSQFSRFIRLLERKIKGEKDKIYVYPIDKKNYERIFRLGREGNYLIDDFFIWQV